jgi:hypothetical protein
MSYVFLLSCAHQSERRRKPLSREGRITDGGAAIRSAPGSPALSPAVSEMPAHSSRHARAISVGTTPMIAIRSADNCGSRQILAPISGLIVRSPGGSLP